MPFISSCCLIAVVDWCKKGLFDVIWRETKNIEEMVVQEKHTESGYKPFAALEGSKYFFWLLDIPEENIMHSFMLVPEHLL